MANNNISLLSLNESGETDIAEVENLFTSIKRKFINRMIKRYPVYQLENLLPVIQEVINDWISEGRTILVDSNGSDIEETELVPDQLIGSGSDVPRQVYSEMLLIGSVSAAVEDKGFSPEAFVKAKDYFFC